MIYFLQAEIIGRIKIGYTSKAKADKRLHNLKCGSPVELKLLTWTGGDRQKEQELHQRFAHARVRGEWFDPVPELVRYVARLQGKKICQVNTARPPRGQRAAEWLTQRFAERPEWPSTELIAAAALLGISRPALFEAKRILNLPPARRRKSPSGKCHCVWRTE